MSVESLAKTNLHNLVFVYNKPHYRISYESWQWNGGLVAFQKYYIDQVILILLSFLVTDHWSAIKSALPTVFFLSSQILIGEAILYCYLSRRLSATQTEANINAAGCNFNSYIRRAVRFIGGRTHAFNPQMHLKYVSVRKTEIQIVSTAATGILLQSTVTWLQVTQGVPIPWVVKCFCFHRCPYIWPLCDCTDNWHSPAVHWAAHPLLAGRV